MDTTNETSKNFMEILVAGHKKLKEKQDKIDDFLEKLKDLPPLENTEGTLSNVTDQLEKFFTYTRECVKCYANMIAEYEKIVEHEKNDGIADPPNTSRSEYVTKTSLCIKNMIVTAQKFKAELLQMSKDQESKTTATVSEDE